MNLFISGALAATLLAPVAPDPAPHVQAETVALTTNVGVVREERFSAVGVTWLGPAEGVSVAFRTRAAGRWSGWTTLDGEDAEVGRSGTELVWTGPSDAVELAWTGPSEVADVRAHLIDPGRHRTRHSAATGIRTRAEWGADEKKMTWRPQYARELRAAVLHHTATTNEYEQDDVPGILRAIYHFQAVSRGWGDVGYHVLVDRFGQAWEGRAGGLDRLVIGAHAGGFNVGTVGVAMIGDFTGVEPPVAQRETVARVLAWKLGEHRLDPRATTTITGGPSTLYPKRVTISVPVVYPHKLTSRTACPGAYGEAALPWLRERAAALMKAG